MEAIATFNGRKESRSSHLLMAVFFLAFLIPSAWFLIAYFPNPASLVVGGSAVLLWTVMLSLCLVNWAAAAAVVTLDSEGFQIEGPLRKERIDWSQISKITVGDQSTGTIRVHLQSGKPVALRLDLIEDGQELGRTIRTKAAEQTRARAFHDKTYPVANLPILTFLFGGGGVLMIVGSIYMTATARHDPWLNAMISGGATIAYIAGVIKQLSHFARIESGRLTYGSVVRKWTVNLDSITAMAVAERVGSPIVLRAKESFWTLPSGLDDPDGLLQHLEYATGLTHLVGALPAEPIPQGQRVEVCPGLGFHTQALWLGGCFLGVILLGVYIAITDHRQGMWPMMIAYFGLFGFMLASTIWMYLVGAARYFMEGNVLERKALTRPWKVDLTQVERAWLRGQFLSVYRLQLPGRVIDLDLAPLKNGWPLVEAISSRIPPSAPEGPREYRGPRSALPLGVIGVIFLVGAVFFPDAIGKVACATFGFLIVGVAYCAYSKRYVTTPDGVWCQNWSGKRFVRFDDVKRLEVDAVAAKYGYLRRLRLEHGQGGVTITSQTEDLTLLEAYIRDHLRPDQIHDSLKKIGA